MRRIRAFGLAGVGLLAPLLAALPAGAADTKTIDLTYDSVMDMVRPETKPNIPVHHNLQIVFSGGGVTEQRDRSVRQFSDANSMAQASLAGDEASYASWRVLPDGRLIRTQNDPQSTRTMTVTLAGDTCHLDVVDQLKPGFTEYAFLRITSHTMGYFSSYRVVRTTCVVR